MKVEIEELELLMDPDDSEVCLRFFRNACRKEKQQDFRDLQYEREK